MLNRSCTVGYASQPTSIIGYVSNAQKWEEKFPACPRARTTINFTPGKKEKGTTKSKKRKKDGKRNQKPTFRNSNPALRAHSHSLAPTYTALPLVFDFTKHWPENVFIRRAILFFIFVDMHVGGTVWVVGAPWGVQVFSLSFLFFARGRGTCS